VSITSPAPDAGGIVHTALGKRCFLCSAKLRDPAICWSGSTSAIFLHPACVTSLFVRMARDVHEIERPGYYRRRFGPRR
jgi:hypothetical protein